MRTHLSGENLVDLLDGPGDAPGRAHVLACAECRRRLEEARAGMVLARQADVPEPSPRYWESFQRQVGRRLDEGRRPWRGLLWPALVTLAAGLLLVAVPYRSRPAPSPPPALLPAWSPLPAAEDDPGLEVLQAVAVQLDPETACSGLEDCLRELSDEEGGALAEMLRREAPGRSS